jgi:cytochrome P450
MATQEKERSKIKRDMMMPFMRSERYDTLFNVILTNFEQEIEKRPNTFDLSEVLQYAVTCAVCTEHFGVDLSEAQKRQLLDTLIPLPDYVKNSRRLFFAKFFENTPKFIQKIILGHDEIYTIQRINITKSFFNMLYKEGKDRSGSIVETLKIAEQQGIITREEVISEYGSMFGSAYTLTELLISSCVLLSKYTHEQEKTGTDYNYAKNTFLEVLRLRASFHTLAYEEILPKSKCPFHFWQRKDIVVVSVLDLQKNKKYWGDDAEEFKPERFAAGLSSFEKGSFVPFGGGERRCPASGMVMTVGAKFTHMICKEYNFTLISKEPELKRLYGLHRKDKPILFKFEKKQKQED